LSGLFVLDNDLFAGVSYAAAVRRRSPEMLMTETIMRIADARVLQRAALPNREFSCRIVRERDLPSDGAGGA
jgi:hypothetical protein